MLGFLFRTLTAEPARGAPMFASVTAIAREPHWYVEGKVPDTLDGRFAMLATVAALFLVRIERDGEAGNAATVALTERFIEVMETEHRELGLGDPALGKRVRKLVGSLARRTELWRDAAQQSDWAEAARDSLKLADDEAAANNAAALKLLWRRLGETGLGELERGSIR